MRTVTLEFVRPGPPHNQLLSPLTRYLALCGSLPAETVQFPFEHSQILIRLRALQYRESRETRELQLVDTAKALGDVLSTVPGLIAELAASFGRREPITHLRLILSANELALLPFELANAPAGSPGAGQQLALQSQVPLCITREVRRAVREHLEWPPPPDLRILFAAASPEGVGQVPLDAHLLALLKVIEPWVYHYLPEERRERVGRHLTILPQASVESIQKACAGVQYTHVHILAHGLPVDKAGDRRFGLALHDSRDPKRSDIVEGARLASLLRIKPAVVTLAACDAGNVGSVAGAGASIAHSLHEAGIPLVVASQFPLSFAGSVVMTQVLYEGFLSGVDPRLLLNELYRQLQILVPDTHDWASIVAYASFPPDLDDQIGRIRVHQTKRRLDAALNYADRATRDATRDTQPRSDERTKDLQSVLDRLAEARHRMEELLGEVPQQRVQIWALLGAAEKRLAEILARAGRYGVQDNRFAASLQKARDYYRQSFQADHTKSWCLVQMLALTAVVEGGDRVDRDLWNLARLLSRQELQRGDREAQAWAHANLIELHLLSVLLKDPPSDARPRALDHARALLELAGVNSFTVHSTRRQIARYLEFFESVQPQWQEVVHLAMDLVGSLPASSRFS